jgi:hypothetical protein
MTNWIKFQPPMIASFVILLSFHSQAQTSATDSLVTQEKQRVHDTFNYLVENNRFTEFLDLTTVVDFPVGIKKTIGNIEYVIAIDSVIITSTYAYLNASMSFGPPGSDERIAFRGTNIRFTQQGGISGDARLELIGDHTFNIPGDKMSLTLKGEGTYVEWDCDGFKEFGVAGGINFSRDTILPVDILGEVLEGEVVSSFSLTLRDWNDLIAAIEIAPFQVNGLDGFVFEIHRAVFDFSDLRNPTGIIFPENYESASLLPNNDNLWRGIFIESVSVRLPSQFAQENGEYPYIKGDNLLIDNTGLSGIIGANYLLPLEEGKSGSMNGWAFSVDEISIHFTSNKLNYSTIEGSVILPITEENSALRYDAFIDNENNYFFNISPSDSLSFELWQAGDVTLFESSYINVDVIEGHFIPSAELNGIMNINAPIGRSEEFNLANIGFEGILLKTKSPYLSGGVFSVGSDKSLPSMANFSLDVEKLEIVNLPDSTTSLNIEVGVALNGAEGGYFAAKGGLSIISEKRKNLDRLQWKYKKTKVKNISLNVDNDAFKFAGNLEFYEGSQVYGNGFSGNIQAEFQPGIQVQASAKFGTLKETKYWYADALASFTSAIPVAPGFGIYGFGGGAYYHMKMENQESDPYSSKSGLTYLPDANSGLGLRAALKLGTTPSPKAFNGNAAFEILFYGSGGMKNINFKGDGYFMTLPIQGKLAELQSNMEKIAKYSSNKDQPENLLKPATDAVKNGGAEVSGQININYDFTNRVLHGNFEIFVNAASGMISGIGANGRAGWAVMHFAPSNWYIHIGTPTERLGLSMGIGNVYAQTNAYLMVGTNIPGSPPPDENVSRILGGIDLDYMRDENALGLGTGYAMGAALNFDTGNLTFWKFYARFMAGAGFDLMLKNYGSDVSCADREGPIGINGWYANGQAYAFFDGKIGILVDVFGGNQEIDIINLAAATTLQAKLPNPIWMRGVVGGYFNALGGLVKGDCRFEITIGEECELNEVSAVSGIKVIADVTPTNGNEEVSVFNNPQVVFNMPIGEIFELNDASGTRKSFRIKVDHFRAKSGQKAVDGIINWNDNLDVAILKTSEILPAKAAINIDVQISFEELVGGNWIPVTANGNIIIERQEVTFTTGSAPDYIPLDNIAYSYPVVEMVNYYKDEYKEGYIQLNKGQAYLFGQDESRQETGRLTSNINSSGFEIEYNVAQKRVVFQLPNLETDQVNTLVLLSTPTADSQSIDNNVTSSSNALAGSTSGSDITVTTKQAEGTIDSQIATVLLSIPFRTSKFKTFKDKAEAIVVDRTMRVLVMAWDQHLLNSPLTMSEQFELSEIEGTQYTEFEPLLKFEAILEGNKYYQNQVYPLIYKDYPIDGTATITKRDTEYISIPPIQAIGIEFSQASPTNNFQTNLSTISTGKSNLIYDLPRFYREDFYDIREKVVPLYINQPEPLPAQVNALMFHTFPFVNEGDYQVRLNYYLPGEVKPHSSYIINTILDFSK